MYLYTIALLILFSIRCARSETQTQKSVKLAPEQTAKLIENALQCIRETGADPAILVQIRSKNFSDDESIKKFLFCSFKKSGVSSKKGLVRTDRMLDFYPEANRESIRKVIEECKKDGNEPMENVYKFIKCFQENTPVRITI